MIGILEGNLIFEFRDEGQLEFALTSYAERKGCSTLFICDRSDKIKSVLNNGMFTSMPNLQEETSYLIYGCPNYNKELPDVNDYLPDTSARGFSEWEILGTPFIYSSGFRIPKPLDYLS